MVAASQRRQAERGKWAMFTHLSPASIAERVVGSCFHFGGRQLCRTLRSERFLVCTIFF